MSPPTVPSMTTITGTHPLRDLDEGAHLHFAGLRLARGPLRVTVRCRTGRFLLCSYRVGGVDRHLVVDLDHAVRFSVPPGHAGERSSESWCRDFLHALGAGTISAPGRVALDVVSAERAA